MKSVKRVKGAEGVEGEGRGDVVIRALAGDGEARRCAEIMAGSEPWITLGRDYEASLAAMRDERLERYVVARGADVLGFLLLDMRGTFAGYIRTVALAPEARGQGWGSRLLAFAEARVFRETPNVFICASSFNPRARALYERLGYEVVGELRDFIVRGHSEILMRKTIGPVGDFAARLAAATEAGATRSADGVTGSAGDVDARPGASDAGTHARGERQ